MKNRYIKISFDDLLELNQKPPRYKKGVKEFWQDPYISTQVLDIHLDQNTDLASRRTSIAQKEVEFIAETLKLNDSQAIVDLGCGPGLYCQRLYKYCKNVTGVDYSENSIRYARESARAKRLDIDYRHLNYLDLDIESSFDAAFIINCDFGALSEPNRHLLLDKVHRALKPAGFLVFDVLSGTPDTATELKNEWQAAIGGFWNPNAHLILQKDFFYPEENATLSQVLVVDENGGSDLYRIYTTRFSREGIEVLLNQHGFRIKNLYGDLQGTPLIESSEMLGIFAQKDL